MKKKIINIASSTSLSNDDHKVLNFLYQPLIGSLSYTLYLLFLNLSSKNSNEYSLDFILDLLNTNSKNFQQAKDKLEAIGLLDTYEKEDYYYLSLKSPFTPRQFLSDSILGKFLYQEIGERNYQKITQIFKKDEKELDGYQNITKNFDDVFKVQSFKLSDDQKYKGKKNNFGVQFNSNFDYEIFIDKLPKKYIKPSLTSFKTVDKVKQLAFVYEFTEDDLSKIYIQSNEQEEKFSLELLEQTASKYFINQKENTNIAFTIKEKDNAKDQVDAINNLTIKKLAIGYATSERSISLLADVNKLLTAYEVEAGVIKVLVIYLSKQKDKDVPNYAYLSKTLQTWINKGITTTEKALKVAKEAQEFKFKTKNKKIETEASKWAKEILDGIDE